MSELVAFEKLRIQRAQLGYWPHKQFIGANAKQCASTIAFLRDIYEEFFVLILQKARNFISCVSAPSRRFNY